MEHRQQAITNCETETRPIDQVTMVVNTHTHTHTKLLSIESNNSILMPTFTVTGLSLETRFLRAMLARLQVKQPQSNVECRGVVSACVNIVFVVVDVVIIMAHYVAPVCHILCVSRKSERDG